MAQDEQLRAIVQRMVERGESRDAIAEVVRNYDAQTQPTPEPQDRSSGFTTPRAGGYDPRRSLENSKTILPSVAAGGAAMAAGPGIVLPAIAAGGAGYIAGRMTGQSREDAAGTGIAQGIGQGIAGAAVPAVVGAGKWIASKADPLIQSAIKPALSEIRAAAGRTGNSLAGESRRIASIVRKTGIRTPEQAEEGIKALEGRVQEHLARVGPDAEKVTLLTDAPARSLRYLDRLDRSASRQMSPGDDVATVASERGSFTRSSPLFQNVTEKTSKQVPSSILDEFGKPMMTDAVEETTKRVPRANVTAGESMELARGTSRHATRKSYGEQKGMSVEAQKALDRAGRDAAKAVAPPQLKADLRAQGELIRLKPILDRMMLRESNRDAASLPGIVGAAPAIAQGKIPVLGMAAQWLRNNQLKAGVGADRLGNALQRTGRAVDPNALRLSIMALLGLGAQE